MDQAEILFDSSRYKDGRRYVLLPHILPKAWEMYKTVQGHFWVAEDILPLIGAPKRIPDLDSALTISGFAATVREAAYPEQIATLFRDPEIASFLGFQVMLENIHLEAAASLVATAVSEENLTRRIEPARLLGAAPITHSIPTAFVRVIESAATYAMLHCRLELLVATRSGDPALDAAARKIARDYETFYLFGLFLCAVAKAALDADANAVMDTARVIVGSISTQLEVPPPVKSSVCDAFLADLAQELNAFRLPAAKSKKQPTDPKPLAFGDRF